MTDITTKNISKPLEAATSWPLQHPARITWRNERMDWDKAFEELANETSRRNDSVSQYKPDAKSKAEHDRGVRLGWHDEDGNSLLAAEEDDEEESSQ